MAKRFSDTDLFKKKFVRGLQGAYKLLWIYIYHDCNHAGMWEPDFEVASLRIGFNVTEQIAKEQFGEKIVLIENGDKWFIPSFIEFQYGKLNVENRAHNSVIQILEKHGIKGLISPLQGAMDMDKDKDKEKDKEKGLLGETEKPKKKPIPPLPEFLEHAKAACTKAKLNYNELQFSIESKYETWVADGWKDGNGKLIRIWKTKFNNTLPHLKAIQSQPGRSGPTIRMI